MKDIFFAVIIFLVIWQEQIFIRVEKLIVRVALSYRTIKKVLTYCQMFFFKGTAKSRWIQLSRGHEIRRIVGRLASAAAITRLIL